MTELTPYCKVSVTSDLHHWVEVAGSDKVPQSKNILRSAQRSQKSSNRVVRPHGRTWQDPIHLPHQSAAPRPSLPPQGHSYLLLPRCQPLVPRCHPIRSSHRDRTAATPCRAPAAAAPAATRKVKGQPPAGLFSPSPTKQQPRSEKHETATPRWGHRAAFLYPGLLWKLERPLCALFCGPIRACA